jgi:hypothetical protein
MMHKFLGLALLTLLFSCSNSDENQVLSPSIVKNPATASSESKETPMAKMVFTDPEQDFETIVQGESIKKVYRFTNEGEADLVISAATGSCGCTVPTYPKNPIKPGQSGEIEVVFNSQGKKGKQNKKVYVTANTIPANNVIVLTGEVVAPE